MSGKKKKTSVGKIILFISEILILVALLVVMWLVLKTTDEEKGVQRLSIHEKEIEVSLPDEVKENEVMQGYRNIALFGVDSREGELSKKLTVQAQKFSNSAIDKIVAAGGKAEVV